MSRLHELPSKVQEGIENGFGLGNNPDHTARILKGALGGISKRIEKVLVEDADGWVITITPYQGTRMHPYQDKNKEVQIMTGKEILGTIGNLLEDAAQKLTETETTKAS